MKSEVKFPPFWKIYRFKKLLKSTMADLVKFSPHQVVYVYSKDAPLSSDADFNWDKPHLTGSDG